MPVHEVYANGQVVSRVEVACTVDDVKQEARRRIMQACGADTLDAALVKQINATKAGDTSLAAKVAAIRAASDVIEQSPGVEVCTDSRWPADDAIHVSTWPLDRVKSIYRNRVEEDAERIRLSYITPGAGMAMTYTEKHQQAQAVEAIGEAAANAMTPEQRAAQFPTLAASVGIEAPTLWQCAALVIQKYEQFALLSGAIERARLTAKKGISDASDQAGVIAAYEAITWPNA